MNNRLISCCIVGLLVSLGFLGFITFESEVVSANILYVGSSSIYTTIQSAVDAANPGDTIVVENGTYNETVTINTSNIDLIGNSSTHCKIIHYYEGTSINNYAAGINVTAGGVTITGFNIRVSGNYTFGIHLRSNTSSNANVINNNIITTGNYAHGIFLYSFSNNNNITINTVNTVGRNGYGIVLYSSASNNTIIGNTIITTGDGAYGIDLSSSSNDNDILGNKINTSGANGFGIYLSMYSNINILTGNIINTSGPSGIGIHLSSSSNNNYLKDNIITTSGQNGYGIDLYLSSNNTLMNHIINTLGENGRGFCIVFSLKNTLTSNIINTSGQWGYGIRLYSSSNNNLKGNIIDTSGQNGHGIFLPQSSNNNTLTGNNITTTNQTAYGIYLNSSSNNNLRSNNISNNEYGIYLTSSLYNNITGNTIYNNSDFGIHLYCSSNNTIGGNSISNITNGIWLNNSSNNDIISNSITSTINTAIFLAGSSAYNTITNNNVSLNNMGLSLRSSSNNTITNNNVFSNNKYGIELESSSNNIIANNIASNNTYGLYLNSLSNNNTIVGNNISLNRQYGIYLILSLDNIIHHNSIIDNVNQAYDGTENGNQWDDGYPSGGNFWSDYDGIDLNSTPTQDIPPPDGMGDTPYIIDANSQDNYPITEPTIQPPSEPRNLQASSGNSYVNITWNAPVLNGSSFIINYRIYRGNTSGGETFLAEIGNILYYNDTSVFNGIIYYYKVIAKNMDGDGPLSNEAIALPLGLPSEPQNLQTSAGNSYVNVSWSAPASDGGSLITNFTIYRGTISGGETFLAEIGNFSYYNDTTATNGIHYYFKVSAKNVVGEGALSNETSATPVTIPTAPQDLQAIAGDGYVSLKWTASSDDGGSPIINYTIYRATTSGGETFLAEIGNILYYNDTSVFNGIIYYYKVIAKNMDGEGPLSNEAIALPLGQPFEPQNLQASAGDSYVNISWSAPASDGGSLITNYTIYRSTISGGETFPIEIGNLLYYNDTTVTNGVTYYFKVSAINSVGEGPLSNEINATPELPSILENQPPICEIFSPSPAATISGFFGISGTASDFDGTVQKVEIKIDNGSWIEVIGNISWNYNWDTTTVLNGHYTIYARSYDGMNYSSETSVNVEVDNVFVKELEKDLCWLWILIVIIVLIVMVIFLFVIRKKKAEVEEKMEEESKEVIKGEEVEELNEKSEPDGDEIEEEEKTREEIEDDEGIEVVEF